MCLVLSPARVAAFVCHSYEHGTVYDGASPWAPLSGLTGAKELGPLVGAYVQLSRDQARLCALGRLRPAQFPTTVEDWLETMPPLIPPYRV